ncbi:hypothetical protein A3Q34_16260 [Colwellia sp. PAMC 20917]|uniref:hypothetical protein n=1 Tax=Colwellia sp. PAMC 20917 TaxID=1816218 RepID=UPI00087883A4|nr:hypothetical protein [Colwellia sp. PAMC 20917]AOW78259.1 hypothetical protein A3Q34_16260 [Colwellia sp. PAMC 20917]
MDQFLSYANGRYLKITFILTIIMSIIYVLHEPGQPKNGGTWFGYTIGTISALLIVWLMYFGRRKRDYFSTLGTVKGWLSAHVYLGSGLLILATLHTGFQFGVNVHTLAYFLMCIAIFSGFYGAWSYVYLPIKKRENLKTISAEEYYLLIEDVDRQIIKLSKKLPEKMMLMINSAIERTEIGGNVFNQLSAKDRSCLLVDGKLNNNENQSTVIHLLVTELAKVTDQQSATQLKQIIDLFGSRKKSLKILRHHIKTDALLKLWLFIHVPISFALLAALLAHILSVFIYW